MSAASLLALLERQHAERRAQLEAAARAVIAAGRCATMART
jgi:hypothetical protein